MRIFTRQEFSEFVANIKGSVIMSLTIKTDAPTKKGAPAILKVKHCPAGLGWDYAKRKAAAEGVPVEQLAPSNGSWHTLVQGALRRHRGDASRLYVEYYPSDRGGKTQYEMGGKLYSYAQVAEHLKAPRKGGDGGTGYRLAKLENIVGGVLNKEPFVVV
jgi:hypothetical protein